MNDPSTQTSNVLRTGKAPFESWLFDLDNTLYPAESNLFSQIDFRMGKFVEECLGVDNLRARELQKQYYHEHGTTLNGLMLHHGVNPDEFLKYVHDIDLSVISKTPLLGSALSRLPGRKIVFTNGSVDHAERVLIRLGIENYFEGIHDIKASKYNPKPNLESYLSVLARFGLSAKTSVMLDDILSNLKPAARLGVTTVWVKNKSSGDLPPGDYIDYITDNLAHWLSNLRLG